VRAPWTISGSVVHEMSDSVTAAAVLKLAGFEVTQCMVDRALSLALRRGDQSAVLRIEGSFRLKLGQEWELDASGDRLSLCPSLQLFGRVIESANLLGTGELEVVLSGDARLLLYSGREYEAWTLSLPNNTLIVSGAEGGVSVFRDRST